MKKDKPRVVLDTNVWISGLVFRGKPAEIINLFAEADINVISSEECLIELRQKILHKFPGWAARLELLEESIRRDAQIVVLSGKLSGVSDDPDDDKFIEAALIGGADFIISGDQDLLRIKKYQNIEIISPSKFLASEII